MALSWWYSHTIVPSLVAFTASIIIFRSDVAVLFAPLLIEGLISKKLNFVKTVFIGIVATLLSLILTIGIDSFFWNRWLWPEGEVFWFNTYHNKSKEWGVSEEEKIQ